MDVVLYKNFEKLVISRGFRGDKYPIKDHNFDEWLYIAGFHAYTEDEMQGQTIKFKVGYTTNLQQRQASLNGNNLFNISIIYAWPVPNAQPIESDIKRYLKNFIHADAFNYMRLEKMVKERSEIIWNVELFTLVKIIRLIILKHAVVEDLVVASPVLKTIFSNFMDLPPEGILDKYTMYGNEISEGRLERIADLYDYAAELTGCELLLPCNIMYEYPRLVEKYGLASDKYNEMTDIMFYDYILDGWKYMYTDRDLKNIPFDTTKPDGLDYNIGDSIKDPPSEVIGYGKGPYEGSYLVKTDEGQIFLAP